MYEYLDNERIRDLRAYAMAYAIADACHGAAHIDEDGLREACHGVAVQLAEQYPHCREAYTSGVVYHLARNIYKSEFAN